jgi:hypothetical protein
VKKASSAILLILASFMAQPALAYDEDVHFYGTYSMARFSGIKHEVAEKIALAAQWMDESYMSDPTSLMFLPLTGVKKRRVLHFPSSRIVGGANVETQNEILGITNDSFQKSVIDSFVKYSGFQGDLNSLNFFTQTEEDHAFGSQMLMEGLKEGNLMKAAGGLHTLEDSFAHAGTAAEHGHADFWHWPDRPHASQAKYFRMTKAVFSALTAIRAMLPPEALDCSLKLKEKKGEANCSLNSADLAAAYEKIPAVRAAIAYDVLRDPAYVKVALKDFYNRAYLAKYLKMSDLEFDKLVDRLKLDGKKDAYEALEDLMHLIIDEGMKASPALKLDGSESSTILGGDLVDLNFMLIDMGRMKSADAHTARDFIEYMESFDADDAHDVAEEGRMFKGFVRSMAYELLAWNVPVPLSDTHRIERENDKGVIREKEMELRIAKMRDLNKFLFKIDVRLVNNQTKDDVGFSREMRKVPEAEATVPFTPDVHYATFSLAEKYEWNVMIFKFLFPSLSEEDLLGLVDTGVKLKAFQWRMADYQKGRERINNSDSYWITKKARLLKLDHEYADVLLDMNSAFMAIFANVVPIAKTYLSDIMNTHSIPESDNFAYRKIRRYTDARNCGNVKELLVPGRDFWTLDSLKIPHHPDSQMPNFLGR